MTRRLLTVAALAAGGALARPIPARADDPPAPVAVDVTNGGAGDVFSFHVGLVRDADVPQRELAEDMDVFGALLKETLEKLYPAAVSGEGAKSDDVVEITTFEDHGTTPPTRRVILRGTEAEVEGFLERSKAPAEAVSDPVATPLAGYGVVFTVTVPGPRPDEPPAQAEAPAEDPKEKCPYLQMDRWDRTRTRLELVRNPRAHRCASCHSNVPRVLSDAGTNGADLVRVPSDRDDVLEFTTIQGFDLGRPHTGRMPSQAELVEAVTGLLAETGRNIRLPADQRVAVVLRFREPANTTPGTARSAAPRNVPLLGWVEQVPDSSHQFRKWEPDQSEAEESPVPLPHEEAGDAAAAKAEYAQAADEYGEARKHVAERLQELYQAGQERSDAAVVTARKAFVRVLTKLSAAQGAAGDAAGQRATEALLKQYPPTSTAWQKSVVVIAFPGKDELAADLLVKQRDYDHAVAKFEAALADLINGRGVGDTKAPRTHEELVAVLRSANGRATFFRLLRKIAQAAVAGGKLEQAAGPLALLAFEHAGTADARPPAPSAPPLPHTLEISVSKKSLDAVGGGVRVDVPAAGAPVGSTTMTKERFREAVTVREFAPQAATDAPKQQQPVPVSGVVIEVVELDTLDGRQFVELSAGADDGIQPGQTVTLHRVVYDGIGFSPAQVLKAVGTAEVLFTTADRSLALMHGQAARRGDRFSGSGWEAEANEPKPAR